MGSVLGGDGRARVCSAEHSSMSIPGAEAHLGEAASATLHGAGISSPRRQDASHRDGSALELRGGTTAASFAPVHFFEAKYGAWRPSPSAEGNKNERRPRRKGDHPCACLSRVPPTAAIRLFSILLKRKRETCQKEPAGKKKCSSPRCWASLRTQHGAGSTRRHWCPTKTSTRRNASASQEQRRTMPGVSQAVELL